MSTRRIATEAIEKIEDVRLRSELLASLCPTASWLNKVKAFHTLYEVPDATSRYSAPDETAAHMTTERLKLRLDLIAEEFQEELIPATDNRDIVEMSDALGDIIYVAIGMALELGINLNSVFSEIHASNMTKLAEDGTVVRREDGKVLKGPNYVKPNIRAALGLK